MSHVVESVCPLCQSAAKCEEHIMRRLKHFVCPVCKEVVIKNKAERHIVDSTQQTRETFSNYCTKAPDGKVTLLSFDQKRPGVDAQYLSLQEALAR